jgi:flagellar hook-associated protein 3 FlgL
MRISTNQQYLSMERAIARSTNLLAEQQSRVVSGRRIEQPSDDPPGAVQSLILRSLISQQEEYQRSIEGAKYFLQHTETAVTELNEIMQQARQMVIQGANDTLPQESRSSLASLVDELMKRVYQIANQKVDDHRYLFAGQKLTTQPFTLNGSTLVFNGDDQPLAATVSNGYFMEMNLPGSTLVDLYDTLNQIKLDLETGNVSRLSNEDLDRVQAQQNYLQHSRGQVGARLSELDRFMNVYEARKEQLTEMLAQNEEVDLPTAIAQMQQSELAYQSALQVAARINALSLLDFLRGG